MKRCPVRYSICILLVFLSFFVGCTQKAGIPVDKVPDIGIPIDKMNTKFRIWIPKDFGNTYKNGQNITMMVSVTTTDELAFTKNYDARIFIYEKDQWEEIENTMIYPKGSEGPQIIRPSNDFTVNSMAASVVPFKSGLEKEVWIRIFLSASIYKDGVVTDEKAVSFIDVPLKP